MDAQHAAVDSRRWRHRIQPTSAFCAAVLYLVAFEAQDGPVLSWRCGKQGYGYGYGYGLDPNARRPQCWGSGHVLPRMPGGSWLPLWVHEGCGMVPLPPSFAIDGGNSQTMGYTHTSRVAS